MDVNRFEINKSMVLSARGEQLLTVEAFHPTGHHVLGWVDRCQSYMRCIKMVSRSSS